MSLYNWNIQSYNIFFYRNGSLLSDFVTYPTKSFEYKKIIGSGSFGLVISCADNKNEKKDICIKISSVSLHFKLEKYTLFFIKEHLLKPKVCPFLCEILDCFTTSNAPPKQYIPDSWADVYNIKQFTDIQHKTTIDGSIRKQRGPYGCLVLESIKGRDLDVFLSDPFEKTDWLPFAFQITYALFCLHNIDKKHQRDNIDISILHRDIGLQNILLQKTNNYKLIKIGEKTFDPYSSQTYTIPYELKLIDYGLSKVVFDTEKIKGSECNIGLVTLLYRPPELLFFTEQPTRFSGKSDVWSLGVVLLSMAFNQSAFYDYYLIKKYLPLYHKLKMAIKVIIRMFNKDEYEYNDSIGFWDNVDVHINSDDSSTIAIYLLMTCLYLGGPPDNTVWPGVESTLMYNILAKIWVLDERLIEENRNSLQKKREELLEIVDENQLELISRMLHWNPHYRPTMLEIMADPVFHSLLVPNEISNSSSEIWIHTTDLDVIPYEKYTTDKKWPDDSIFKGINLYKNRSKDPRGDSFDTGYKYTWCKKPIIEEI